MQPLIMLLGHIVCYAYSEASTVGSRSDEEVTPCRCEAIRNSHTGESQLVLGQIETYANVLQVYQTGDIEIVGKIVLVHRGLAVVLVEEADVNVRCGNFGQVHFVW